MLLQAATLPADFYSLAESGAHKLTTDAHIWARCPAGKVAATIEQKWRALEQPNNALRKVVVYNKTFGGLKALGTSTCCPAMSC